MTWIVWLIVGLVLFIVCILITRSFRNEWKFVRQAAADSVSPADIAAAQSTGSKIAARGKIALALGGGGAKGAYQIGCCKALSEAGIADYDAVAGTSVGALNAVLIAQNKITQAENIWKAMSFRRVLQPRWRTFSALLIRLLLLPVYIVEYCLSDKLIPVVWWRATQRYQREFTKNGNPWYALKIAFEVIRQIQVSHPEYIDQISFLVLYVIIGLGFSSWWLLSAPLLTLVITVIIMPLAVMLLLLYTDWFISFLKQLATNFAITTNEPLHQLIKDCADPKTLCLRRAPVMVTLATMEEVTRPVQPPDVRSQPQPPFQQPDKTSAKRSTGRIARWWHTHVTGDRSSDYSRPSNDLKPKQIHTIEYVPYYFDIRKVNEGQFHELILQSAGLPEIFPERTFGEHSFIDGGIVDNEPVTAIAKRNGVSCIVVIPLDYKKSESRVKKDFLQNIERVQGAQPDTSALQGRFIPDSGTEEFPAMLVLTPSRNLGCFLFGTMGFYARRSRALLQLGYCDTIRKLASIQIS